MPGWPAPGFGSFNLPDRRIGLSPVPVIVYDCTILQREIMELRTQYWLSIGLAGVLLLLVIANVFFYQGNVGRQSEVNNRQALIQQAAQLEGLNREMLQALAGFSVGQGDKQGDKQIGQMLETLGIKVTPTPANPAQPTPPAGAKPK